MPQRTPEEMETRRQNNEALDDLIRKVDEMSAFIDQAIIEEENQAVASVLSHLLISHDALFLQYNNRGIVIAQVYLTACAGALKALQVDLARSFAEDDALRAEPGTVN